MTIFRVIGWLILGFVILVLYFMNKAGATGASDRILNQLEDRGRPAVAADLNEYDARCYAPSGRTVATVRGGRSATGALRQAQREADRFGSEVGSCRVDRRR